MNFKNHYKAGIWAEYYAAGLLFLKGYKILKMRYKTKVGEVDVVAKRGKTICFVEVKYRQDFDKAIEAITVKSQSRIRRASQHFLLGFGDESHTIRFDVIVIKPNFYIRHMCNVF